MLFALCMICAFSNAAADVPVPPYIKVCARTDPNFNECARTSGQAALPFIAKGDRKHLIPTMDPLEVSRIESTTGDKNSPTRLNIVLENLKGRGLGDGTIEEIRHDFDKKEVYWRVSTPKIAVDGRYNISGQILVVPIRGNGDFNITLKDVILEMNNKYDLIQKPNGKTYIKVADTKLTYDISRFYIYLDNLFDGNNELGTEINSFLNENWKETSEAVGPILAEAINQVFRSMIETLTDNIPYDEAFPEKLT